MAVRRRRLQGEQAAHRNGRDAGSVEFQGDGTAGAVRRELGVGVTGRMGVDLNLVGLQVEDPVERNACPGVNARLVKPVCKQAGIGYFDQQSDSARTGMRVQLVWQAAAHYRDVWLRLATVECHGCLDPNHPATGRRGAELFGGEVRDGAMS